MSQQKPRQRPDNQQQARPMPPQAAPPQYNQPLPPQSQPSQPEKIYIEKQRNPVMMVLKGIAYPFVKIAEIIGNALAIIFQELVRSILSFVIGLILLIVFLVLIVGYGFALVQTNFSFVEAVPEMFRIIASFFGFGG